MIFISQVMSFLKPRLSVEVYNSYVPENEKYTAVAVYNITNSQERDLESKPMSKASFWRIVLVSVKPSDIEQVASEILAIDNVSDDTFQKVYTEIVNEEPLEDGSLLQRTFFDLTLYER